MDAVKGDATTETRPVLRIVSPDATPEEIAAIVAVFSALQAGPAAAAAADSRVVRAPPQGAPHAPARPRRVALERAASLICLSRETGTDHYSGN